MARNMHAVKPGEEILMRSAVGVFPHPENENDLPESLDPNDSDLLRDQLKGGTVEHAKPPRLEDEGQPGG